MRSEPILHHLVSTDAHREMCDEVERTASRRLIEARLEQPLKNELQTQLVVAVGDVVVERFAVAAAGQAIPYSATATMIAATAFSDCFQGVPTEVSRWRRRLIIASPAQNTSAIAARE
jgi:hypothetical protein